MKQRRRLNHNGFDPLSNKYISQDRDSMPKKPTYFQERKEFIARMLTGVDKIFYGKEQKIAKDLFLKYPAEFLISVKQPFKLNSIAWFLTQEGLQYLDKNYKIWKYKPEEKKIIEGTEKIGYSYKNRNIKKFRDFLDE